MNIIEKKTVFFAISLIVMIPGLIALMLWGLRLSIDFTGGSRMTYQVPNEKSSDVISTIKNATKLTGGEIIGNIQADKETYTFRTKTLIQKQHENLTKLMQAKYPVSREVNYETVGPIIGGET